MAPNLAKAAEVYALDTRPEANEVKAALARGDASAVLADLPQYQGWLRTKFLEATALAYDAGQRQAITAGYQQLATQLATINHELRGELAAQTQAINLATAATGSNTTALAQSTTATTALAQEVAALRQQLQTQQLQQPVVYHQPPVDYQAPPQQPVVVNITNSNDNANTNRSVSDTTGETPGWGFLTVLFVLMIGAIVMPLGRSIVVQTLPPVTVPADR